jgi:hypothetical protein
VFCSIEKIRQVSGNHFVGFLLIRMEMRRDTYPGCSENESCLDLPAVGHGGGFEQFHRIATGHNDWFVDCRHREKFQGMLVDRATRDSITTNVNTAPMSKASSNGNHQP